MDPSVVGALISAGGQLLGGLFGRGKRDPVPPYREIVKRAKAAGIHPLEALRAGGFQGRESGPRVLSTLAASGAFDTLADALSGKDKLERELKEVDIALGKIAINEAKRGRIISGTTGALVGASPENPGIKEVAGAHEVIQPNGTSLEVPVGPDLDEMITGAGIKAATAVKEAVLEADKAAMDNYNEGKPIWSRRVPRAVTRGTNDPRVPDGVTVPDGWSQWDEKRRTAWLVRWGYIQPPATGGRLNK